MAKFASYYVAAVTGLLSLNVIGAESADPLARGQEVYQGTCIACHGADGTGMLPGVPDLTTQDGPMSNPDDVLVERMLNGFQSPGSPMAMPAKGGNPNLNEEDIRAVLHYLRAEFGS